MARLNRKLIFGLTQDFYPNSTTKVSWGDTCTVGWTISLIDTDESMGIRPNLLLLNYFLDRCFVKFSVLRFFMHTLRQITSDFIYSEI